MNVEEIRILKPLHLCGDFRMKWNGDISLDPILKFLKGISKATCTLYYTNNGI